jgi:hypothetical protein
MKVGSTDLQIWTDRNHALSSINEMAFDSDRHYGDNTLAFSAITA